MATNTLKITVTIEWHGKRSGDNMELKWWDYDDAESILSEIMEAICDIQ